MIEIPEELQRAGWSLLVTVVAGIILRYFQPQSKVIWATTHGFAFTLMPDATPQPDQAQQPVPARDAPQQQAQPFSVYTETVFVQNIGKGLAEDVEVHFNFRPGNMQIWPTFNYEVEINPEGRHTVRVRSLGPSESFSLELLQVHVELPLVLRVRSKTGEAKRIPMAPTRVYPVWFNRTIGALLFFALFSLFYFLSLLLPTF